TPASGFFGMR
uniref:Tachykinin-related peptide 4 n=1 Tax=Pyrrhocoris apterus TaxID=37000 RepID=TRP4_PYRAP|nr:RecName: Full=Tachykinin-related peptide 4; Short=TKRP-4 [Pyrrhocoris apterus]